VTAALDLTGIRRTYRPPTGLLRWITTPANDEPVTALDGVDLRVDQGEIVGLIGPNGAGKTTLIRIVAGLLSPDAGTVEISGRDPAADAMWCRHQVGLVLADERSLYWRLTALENLRFHGSMYGLRARVAADRGRRLLECVGLDHAADRRVWGYSSGMRARLAIARALVHDPDLLVLDEPTRSLDPLAAVEECDLLRRLADDGRAVLLSSHRLEELVRVADRVAVLLDGRIRFLGSVEQMRSEASDVVESLVQLLASDTRGEAEPA
jgi:ABC-2 type transport system ATP-binding protein